MAVATLAADGGSNTVEPQPIRGTRFDYLDATAAAGTTHYYWIQVTDSNGAAIMSGPVAPSRGHVEGVLVARDRKGGADAPPLFPRPLAKQHGHRLTQQRLHCGDVRRIRG